MTVRERLRAWWTGDDGHTWWVYTEPSVFRWRERKCAGPFTRRKALWYGRNFVIHNPFGEALLRVVQPGPPVSLPEGCVLVDKTGSYPA